MQTESFILTFIYKQKKFCPRAGTLDYNDSTTKLSTTTIQLQTHWILDNEWQRGTNE